MTKQKLRWIVHRRSQNGSNFERVGRAKLLDIISEENIKNKFNQNVKINNKLELKEFANSFKEAITRECFETYKRRFPHESPDNFKEPSKRTLDRYFKNLSNM